jgi:hypothetical protein
MEHSRNISPENKRVHELVDRYLISRRILKSSAAETSVHLDDDSLATFVEGTLSQRELGPVVNHLVDCGFCLHKTAELVRLDLELSDSIATTRTAEAATQPAKISAVLSDLFSKIFGTNDGAVFAHQEKNDSEEASDEKEPDEKK